MVGGLLASRLEPLEKTLLSIQHALGARPRRAPSSRREMRSVSAELQESDADDEDEEPVPRRSLSPRKDRRMEQVRVAVMEALASQERNHPSRDVVTDSVTAAESAAVLKALDEMKEHMTVQTQSHTGFNADEFRKMVEDAVEHRPFYLSQRTLAHWQRLLLRRA